MDHILNENHEIVVETREEKKTPKLAEERISRYSKALRKLTVVKGGKNA